VVSVFALVISDSFSRAPANTEDNTRDLQERVGRFARMTFVISGIMFVASLVTEAITQHWSGHHTEKSRGAHLTAQVLLGLVWLACRRLRLKESTIYALDAGGTIVVCACWAVLGLTIPKAEPIESSIMLATTYTVIARSVLVPSSFTRTFVISAIAILPTIYFFFERKMGFIVNAREGQIRGFLIFSTLWCGVAVFTAALNSRQLYGLRRAIREVGKLGQYTLEEKLGEGGMGVVYRATHAMLRRPAAIKLLLPERTGERDLVRFEREVQLTSRLTHPNTISIFDYGRSADGTFYYVMEYLDGFDLEQLVESEGAQPASRVIRILAQASGALAEAHALGLIHRDVKPANIILTERIDEPDVVKVVDFGLVRRLNATESDVQVTQASAITGTPMYLAPEAITAPDTVDGASDLYALGAVGYYLVTGKQVFEATSVLEMCSKHLLEKPIPPSERLGRPVPQDLETLLLACLEKNRCQRPASAAALRAALLACADAKHDDSAALRAWWQDRGAQLRTRQRVSRSSNVTAAMAIDLRGRAAAATTT
jgi:hypothetical protein